MKTFLSAISALYTSCVFLSNVVGTAGVGVGRVACHGGVGFFSVVNRIIPTPAIANSHYTLICHNGLHPHAASCAVAGFGWIRQPQPPSAHRRCGKAALLSKTHGVQIVIDITTALQEKFALVAQIPAGTRYILKR